jgi:hypothetical protein
MLAQSTQSGKQYFSLQSAHFCDFGAVHGTVVHGSAVGENAHKRTHGQAGEKAAVTTTRSHSVERDRF